jgi:DnaJ-class molecular chaperone
MKKPREATEMTCPACDGKGYQKITQPTEPGRKIYPATCKECLGKGHIKKPQPGAG